VFAKHSRSFSLIDSLAVGVDRTRRNFGPMQKKGSMRKKGTKLLQILINASLEMSASSFNRRPAFLCGEGGEGLTLASLAPLRIRGIEVRLTPDQEAFVRQAIESGRLHRAEDAVEEALLLWEERERERAEFLATLDDAKASLARGEGRNITQESMRDLAEEVKLRGQVRLAE